MRPTYFVFVLLAISAMAGCMQFKVNQALPATANILRNAQPSLQMESDYEMAARAIPAALKTVEGFWISAPDNEDLIAVLTEGYCQYGTAFVEDEWEVAKFAKKLDDVDYHNERATKMFTRCLNYALLSLGDRWKKDIFGTTDTTTKLIADTGSDDRDALMWASLALGSLINHNLTHVEMISYLPNVKLMLARVVELDKAHPPSNPVYAALPHVALGMVWSGASVSFGGDPKLATEEFNKAIELTGGKMLLPRVLMAYRVGIQTNDRKLFHDNLVKVLETPGSVWPEQRLANEVAHRRARRYLSHEKDLFQ